MSDLQDLYQEMILDHSKRPRNFGPLDGCSTKADGHNPLCGDRLTLFVKLDGDRIADARFVGQGCAISTASASLMTEAVKGKTIAEAHTLFHAFHEVLTGQREVDAATLGKLAVLAGVAEFPIRVKCATLSWHTLEAALANDHKPASTE